MIASTYRLQLHRGFGFDDAAATLDYLKSLGISHVYFSPYLQAAPGSTHGYDVVNYGQVNEELGGAEAHARLLARLKAEGLGQVLDIVPNHMAISSRNNVWWWDVLENGPASRYSSYFDIDWQAPEEKLRDKVLLPVLGDHYGRVLSSGQIRLERESGSFAFHYFDHVFPAAPGSLPRILSAAAERVHSDYLAFLSHSLSRLPDPANDDGTAMAERHHDKEVIRGLLTRLCAESPEIARSIDTVVDLTNRNPDTLDALLEAQNYRLSFWRTAARDLGYRRFFDINSLVGLRMERQDVFDDTHRLVLDWVRDGLLDGLRVDHPDGLRDPEGYLERLHKAAPRTWIVVEKILERGEELRRSWVTAGTTGYDFLNLVNGLFVDPRAEERMTGLYREFSGESSAWPEVARKSKELVLRDVLGSDLNRLTAMFVGICERHRDNRDFTRHEIHHALRELVTCFPVYRTYVRAEQGYSSAEDERYLNQALEQAKSQRADLDPGLFEFMRVILLLRERGDLETEFVMQFQQFTGPAMAKGIEDTAFYNFNRLVALNEVGGDPGAFGVSAAEFHAWCERISRDWPETMLASSTHDTKRSEDVRSRIVLLSAIPEKWSEAVARWAARAEGFKTGGMPDRNTEYLLYQTLVGAWPIGVERLQAYMLKAAREAKRFTSWTSPNAEFENALRNFVERMMQADDLLEDARRFIEPLISPGRIVSLAQLLIKLTAPGVPDIYQGTELWDLSLVDPDNRRPVDYGVRRELLASLARASVEEVTRRDDEGLSKLWVLTRTLRLRERLGAYRPLTFTGERRDDALAFARGSVITIVPLHPLTITDWGDTAVELPSEGTWRNALTDDEVTGKNVILSALFRRFPVALLTAS